MDVLLLIYIIKNWIHIKVKGHPLQHIKGNDQMKTYSSHKSSARVTFNHLMARDFPQR